MFIGRKLYEKKIFERPAYAVHGSNDAANNKSMEIGSDWAGQTFYDILGNCSDTVTIDEDGWGDFPVSEKSVSVWTIQD